MIGNSRSGLRAPTRAIVCTTLIAALSACGGGGGEGAENELANPEPTPAKTISGVAMLGPIENADVELFGTVGSLGTGRTGASGAFGPISYSGNYEGPIRIVVSGNGVSQWTCDRPLGCPVSGADYEFGAVIPYDFSLEAVLPSAIDSQTATVSLLSDIVVARMNALGGLSTENATQADADIANMMTLVLPDVLNDLDIALPDNIAGIDLVNLNDLPEPGDDNNALSVVASLFNAALLGRNVDKLSGAQFVQRLGDAIAQDPALPVSSDDAQQPSRESFAIEFRDTVAEFFAAGDPRTDAINALLAPSDLGQVFNAAQSALVMLPSLELDLGQANAVVVPVDDASLEASIEKSVEIVASDGSAIDVADFGLRNASSAPAPWVEAELISRDGRPNLMLVFDNRAITDLANGRYTTSFEIFSDAGVYRGVVADVMMDLARADPVVEAGTDHSADERATVDLSGSVSRPDEIVSVNWSQTAGPSGVIADAAGLQTSLQLPAIDADTTLSFELVVEFRGGASARDTLNIAAQAFPNIADVSLADPVLQQCVNDAAEADGLVEVAELETLVCSGVSDLSGLDALTNIRRLELPGNFLVSLQALLDIAEGLDHLDVSGNSNFRCAQVNELAQILEDGESLIVDDRCRGRTRLALGANAFDVVVDESREQLYVSVPGRDEIVVVSSAEPRVVDRIRLPGAPYGIDLSDDGRLLYAALRGRGSIAVVSVDTKATGTLSVLRETGSRQTYDVAETEPNRIFVSASPGGNRAAYIAQVRLDGRISVARVADGTQISDRPTFAASPDNKFVYVSNLSSPAALYRLNLADTDAGVDRIADGGSVRRVNRSVLNRSGTKLALRSGQVLDTETLAELGRVPPGAAAAGRNTDTLFVASGDGRVEFYDFASLESLSEIQTGCTEDSSRDLFVFGDDQSFLMIQDDAVCIDAMVLR